MIDQRMWHCEVLLLILCESGSRGQEAHPKLSGNHGSFQHPIGTLGQIRLLLMLVILVQM